MGKNRLHGNPQGVGVKRKKGSHCLDYSAGIPSGSSSQQPVRQNEGRSLEGFRLLDAYENSYRRATSHNKWIRLVRTRYITGAKGTSFTCRTIKRPGSGS